jgi:hypothetical protein|tara:strand:- start:5754 stop:6743 length:990 start_codon:yes stop_codon:yes gene_type:complete
MSSTSPYKSANDPGLSSKTEERKSQIDPTQLEDGKGCTRKEEAVPNFIYTDCESTGIGNIEGQNNTFIVLGRDRPSGRHKGYGGRGDSQAGAIDIVVGRMGSRVLEVAKLQKEKGPKFKLLVNPSFKYDASRIHISQKTDVDYNFRLVAGTIGSPAEYKRPTAAIAIKSDNIRLIAREGIKIVTMGKGQVNSQGGSQRNVKGIDIIAGNQDTGKYFSLQPIVKGTNLVGCLSSLATKVEKLNGIVQALAKAQNTYNKAISTHFHHSPFWGEPTLADVVLEWEGTAVMNEYFNQIQRSIEFHKKNMAGWRSSYLWSCGGNYINSRYNNVN